MAIGIRGAVVLGIVAFGAGVAFTIYLSTPTVQAPQTQRQPQIQQPTPAAPTPQVATAQTVDSDRAACLRVLLSAANNTQLGYPKGKDSPCLEPKPRELYQVIKVYDGDTSHVLLYGFDVGIRFAGLDTPEIRPAQCFGDKAKAEAERLLQGKKVRLEVDSTKSDHWDTYHRLIAYVYLEDGRNYNAYMIEHGLGHAYAYAGKSYLHQEEFEKLYAQAKAKKIGMWADPKCAEESIRANNRTNRPRAKKTTE